MKDFTTKDIRNVVLLGHGGCGKTTLVEALAFASGATNRLGRTADGNTISDFDKEEIKRQFSINTSLIPLIWEDTKINILDTPGYFDFVGEVEQAVSAADAAVIVVNGKTGVEAGTIKAWEICEKNNLPRMFFVTGMDDDKASYRQVVEKLTELYGRKIAPFHQPIRENERFVGYINIVKMNARRFTGIAQYEETDIPDYSVGYMESYREQLMDAVASTNDELMEKFFEGEEFTADEINKAIYDNVVDGSLVPVTMGSGQNVYGAFMLLNNIVRYFPAPNVLDDVDPDRAFSAKVFKTIADPFMGKHSLIKVMGGTLTTDTAIYNPRTDVEEKISRLYVLMGKETIEVKQLAAGDIGSIAKLNGVVTGDTLCTKGNNVEYPKYEYTVPYTYMRYKVANKGDEDKVAAAIAKLLDEDVTLKMVNDKENRQLLLYGIGDQHLEVVASKLETKYRVKIDLTKPKFAYRETIKKTAKAQGKYKKQSGGHGQYGDVIMEFSPLGDTEKAYEFSEKVFGGAVPKNYFPAVEKGIAECTLKGLLAAYPVVGINAVLLDGSYHPVDSSELAFKMAATMAFRKAFMEAHPVLLEPIATLKVTVPDRFTGDVMGDLNKRRARVMGMEPADSKQVIIASIPMSELYGYSTVLRSMTGGYGDFSYEFSNYEQAPSDVAEKEIAARADKVDKGEL
ncbi:MAG: elongation factor G [Lachnospiraceae bacterium]|nr:elongation factor G [Lachnospiraceae bacterium]